MALSRRHHRKKLRDRRRRGREPSVPGGQVEAPPEADATTVKVFRYGPNRLHEDDVDSWGELKPLIDNSAPVTWIDVRGLANVKLIEHLAERYKIHPLALEDVMHLHQRPKVDRYEDNTLLVVRMARLLEGRVLDVEQVSIVVCGDTILTFQEHEGDSFEPLRRRIRESRGRIRGMQADYLAYALLDSLVDALFPVLEEYGEYLESIEVKIFEKPEEVELEQIHELRRELLSLRRSVWPLREMITNLVRDEFGGDVIQPFLRDVADHAIQVAEVIDSHREHAGGLLDVYLSALGHQQNEVMKLLTIIGSIFIPLSFMVGLYGMNFDTSSPYNMPELSFRYGYFVLVGVMATVVIGMLSYFRRKRWF